MYDIDNKIEKATAVVMMIMGVLVFFDPFGLALDLAHVIAAGLFIYGAFTVFKHLRAEASDRKMRTLPTGTALMILSGLMLWTAAGNSYGAVYMLSTLTFAIGFFTLISGIEQIRTFTRLRSDSVSGAELMLSSGVINLLLTAIIFFAPLLSGQSMNFIWGLYMTMTGLLLLTESTIDMKAVHQAS